MKSMLGLIFCSCLSVSSAFAAPLVLKLGTSSVAPPYGSSIKDGVSLPGISTELAQLIAVKLDNAKNVTAQIVLLSRKRLELELAAGTVDLVCRTKREWLHSPDNFDWSGPLFEKQDLIVGLADAPIINSLQDLKGKTLGTITGYFYSKLEADFASHAITRDDGPSEDGLLRKLRNKRSQYAIIDANIYAYYVKQTNSAKLFRDPPFALEKHMTECAISRKSVFTPAQFANAFAQIREQKLLEPILQKYR